jgi:hypothetical protein
MKRIYGDFGDFERFMSREKQTQSNPILFSPQIFLGLKWNLKKQSQFAGGQIGVKSFLKGTYEKFIALRRRKNKANQTQSPAFGRKSEALSSKF